MQRRRERSAGAQETVQPVAGVITWAALIRAFGSVGLTSFGGGRVAYFWHALVVRRRWLTDSELLEGVAISQLLPGPNIANLSVYLGGRLRGGRGALLAIAAVLAPGALMMLVLSILYLDRGQTPALAPVFRGVGAGAAGLALASTIAVGARSVRSPAAILLAATTFLCVALFHLNPLAVIIPLAVAGALWSHRQAGRGETVATPAPRLAPDDTSHTGGTGE